MAKVVHFDLPVDDPDRARAFYEQAFGWRIEAWGGPMDYWLAETGPEAEPGIGGGLARRSDPDNGVVLTVGVDSVEEALAAVEAAGGRTAVPKSPIPGVGWMACFHDTEGNYVCVMEEDPQAG